MWAKLFFIWLLISQSSSSLLALDKHDWTDSLSGEHPTLVKKCLAERKALLIANMGQSVPPMGELHNKTMAVVKQALLKSLNTHHEATIWVIGAGHGYEAADVMVALADMEMIYNQWLSINVLVIEPHLDAIDIWNTINQFLACSGFADYQFDKRLEIITGYFPQCLHTCAKADVIICNNMLNRLAPNDIISAVQAMSDGLCPGGLLSLSAPASVGFCESTDKDHRYLIDKLEEKLGYKIERYQHYYQNQIEKGAQFPGFCYQLYLTKSLNSLDLKHCYSWEIIADGYCLDGQQFTGVTTKVLLPPRTLRCNSFSSIICTDIHACVERVVFISDGEMQTWVNNAGLEVIDAGLLEATGQAFALCTCLEPNATASLKSFVMARKSI
jgi:hypothetical protein